MDKENTHLSRKDDSKNLSSGKIVFFVFVIFILASAWVLYGQYSKNKAIEECKAIEDSPELNFPCVCYPSPKPKDIDSTVDTKTQEYCRCDCDIGNNQTYTAYILKSLA